jgi:hypothetical protein
MIKYRTHVSSNKFINIAAFSEDLRYRYILSRDWKEEGDILAFILLNPSIGDEKILERTTTGCMNRAHRLGYSGMVVMNLFAYISTNPAELKKVMDPVGPFNDSIIESFFEKAEHQPGKIDVIAAWGRNGRYLGRDKEVVRLVRRPLMCLGQNKDGTPKHPLHLSYDELPRPYVQP